MQTQLKAKGLHRPGMPPGEAKMPKPLLAEIDTRFIFYERLVEVDGQGMPHVARVDQLGAAAAQPRAALRFSERYGTLLKRAWPLTARCA